MDRAPESGQPMLPSDFSILHTFVGAVSALPGGGATVGDGAAVGEVGGEHVVTIATTKMEKVLANLGRGWR
jgi:hypothetical protein